MSEGKTQTVVRVDPQALLTRAVENNASIETLERLVALAKDVREVQAKEAWHMAMAEFQRRCPSIKKTSTANIYTAKGSYKYNYAPLDEIMETIRPLLGELGLTVSWSSRVEPQRVIVSCRIAHLQGYAENSGEVSMPIPDDSERGGGNPAQRVGSALTYARRYSLLSVTGLSPEDDDDARATEKHKPSTDAHQTIKPEHTNAAATNVSAPSAPLQSVDHWRLAYDACHTLGEFSAVEDVLRPIWAMYAGEERTAIKIIRDKTKVRVSEA